MAENGMAITYENGAYQVRAIQRSACGPCLAGWGSGSIKSPKDGGPVCTHGQGLWQTGQTGPRGGWRGISPTYKSERAARLVCDALAEAARVPAQGIPQR